jgi:anti-sigma-K factor RskA
MTDHEMNALTGAYALDALDEQERARFEKHLATCTDCAEEVRSLRAAAAELSQLSPTEPPAGLRDGLLAAIGQVRPQPPLGQNVVPLRPRGARRWQWQSVAAACVLIAAAAAGWGYQQRVDANHAHAQANAITQVLDSPDAATVAGTVGGTGHATVIYSKTDARLILIGHDLAAPPGSKTYQLWMIDRSGHATSAGLFTPNSSGAVLVQASGDLGDTANLGVSVEPAGGSRQPTPGAIVALLKI